MGLLSLSWFKSEKQKELEALEVEEKKLKIQQLQNNIEYGKKVDKEEEEYEIKQKLDQKLYSSIKLVNNTLTVVLKDGTIFSKSDAKQEDFLKVKEAKTENDILVVFATKEAAQKIEDVKKTLESIDVLKGNEDFILENNSVYIKVNGVKINRSLPKLLIDKFAEITKNMHPFPVDESIEYQSLKKFWLWCCLNKRPEVADKLYEFLTKNGMKITKQGFFVALRNVVKKDNCDSELVDFITNVYNKIRAVWKKRPKDYFIYKTEEGYKFAKSIEKANSVEEIGNLEELYLNLPNMKENSYTDDYTRTFDIKIGKKVNMDPEDCNWSTQDCATAGLHFAGHTAPYVLCGDTTVFMLINPMKVVGIGSEKGRCYEYLPFMTTTVGEADEIMNSNDFDFLELDEIYVLDELDNLENNFKKGIISEIKKYTFSLNSMDSETFNSISTSLNEMRNQVKNRVVNIN